MPSFCSHHNSVPLEQESVYGNQLAIRDDDRMFSVTFKVNWPFMTLKIQTKLLLSVINAFILFYSDLRADVYISE